MSISSSEDLDYSRDADVRTGPHTNVAAARGRRDPRWSRADIRRPGRAGEHERHRRGGRGRPGHGLPLLPESPGPARRAGAGRGQRRRRAAGVGQDRRGGPGRRHRSRRARPGRRRGPLGARGARARALRPRAVRAQDHPAPARTVRARSSGRRHPRRHRERATDRVADRLDRRRAGVHPAARQGGHDRHDHRPLPRRSPRSRSATSMNEHQSASARLEEEQMDREPDRPARDEQPDRRTDDQPSEHSDATSALLQELVSYLRDNRTELREEWARRISEAELLGVMSDEEIFSEATEVYDNYVDALETGSIETLQTYARELSERIIPRGVETHEVLGIVLLLRDVLARSLFAKYQEDRDLLNRILDAYEPAANRIAVTVSVSFVDERERVIKEQQEAMRELSTPVLQLRDRLLILPIIGVLDSARARQLTEQLLGAIRDKRATVVVIDITGVATIDRTVANHLVQTVEASRLMGARTILTGLSSEIAQTLVDLDVDVGMMKTVGDLQGGLEEAERLAGYGGAHAGDLPPDAA